ncbi:hypothetical protein ACLB2K_025238 [Fragaria x ananassa]
MDSLRNKATPSSSPNISYVELRMPRSLPVPTTTVVNWQIGDVPCEEAQKNKGNITCKGNSICVNRSNVNEGGYESYDGWPLGYICRCLPGYQGNPYLPDGCQSISASVLFVIVLASRHGVEMAKIFTAEELEKATNNYNESRVLGEGGCGIVYKGMLQDSRTVAIKKPKVGASSHSSYTTPTNNTPSQQFVNEVVILSQINHINVVRGKRSSPPLLWDLRLKIATETAGALAYLHSSTSMPILHRDVKTMNILLDENYTAKVADFGASQLIRPLDEKQMTTFVQGTLGYLDPEYFHSDEFTEKSDVYSFGVVLVELLTSKKAFSFARPEAERNLSKLFGLNEILDNEMVYGANMNDGNVLENVAYLATRCLRVKVDERPTMREVAMELECLYKGLSPIYDMIKHQLLFQENSVDEDLLGSPTSTTADVLGDDEHQKLSRDEGDAEG